MGGVGGVSGGLSDGLGRVYIRRLKSAVCFTSLYKDRVALSTVLLSLMGVSTTTS